METTTLVVIILLIIALLFFGYSMLNSNNTGRVSSGSSYAPSSYGGGCGR